MGFDSLPWLFLIWGGVIPRKVNLSIGRENISKLSKKHNFDEKAISKKYQLLLKNVIKSHPNLTEVQIIEIKNLFLKNPNVKVVEVNALLSFLASRGKI